MKMIILSQYFLPEMGAPQSRLYELAMGLRSRGWDVSVVTAMPNYPFGRIFKGYRNRFFYNEVINGLTIRRFWIFASNSSKIFPRILSMLSFSLASFFSVFFIRSRNPQYLLVESPPLTLAITGWILSLLSGSRMILNISDIWPLSAKELGAINEGFAYNCLERLERFLYKKSFLCLGQSNEIVSHIESTHIAKAVYLFRNGVDTDRFSATTFDLEERNKLVYVGLLGIAQDVLSICQNINFHELGAEFHIYGAGPQQNAITKYLASNPNSGIKYMGLLNRETVPETLTLYGATIIPLAKHIYGAVPSKIYESLAAGLPILFCGGGEGSAIIEQHRAGWVNAVGDWFQLRQNIIKLLKLDENALIHLRNSNRITAVEYFNRSNQIENLSQYLRTL